MVDAVVRSPLRGLTFQELAQWTKANAVASALLCDVAAKVTTDAVRTQRRALLLRLSSRPETHFARLLGEIDGVALPAVVRRDGLAIARRDWLEAAGLRLEHRSDPWSPARGRGPLRATLSLSRSCDRVLQLDLLDTGHGRRALGGPSRAVDGGAGAPLFVEPGSFAMEVVVERAVPRLLLFGRLDAATAPTIQMELAEVAASVAEVDLAALTSFDDRGLRALLAARARAREAGVVFRLARAPHLVRRVFEAAGRSDQLDD